MVWKLRHGTAVATIVLFFLFVASLVLAPTLQRVLEPYFASEGRLAGFATVIVTLGGALVGATAIAFSVVMFAVQINFARIPHGLFRKLSSDRRLLGYFIGTFILAIGVTTLSLLLQKSWLAITVLSAVWATALIPLLFICAYRRALSLIDPSQQLGLLTEDANREMRAWVHRAQRAAPLLEPEEPKEDGATDSSTRVSNTSVRQRAPRLVAETSSRSRTR